VIALVLISPSSRGGESGGVTGRAPEPGGHTGMCLLGIAAGVPRDEVLSDRCVGGGVEVRAGIDGALATAAAMLAIEGSTVQLKARDATC